MTNVTINLTDKLLEEARQQAMADNTSLNAVVKEFLERYVARQHSLDEFNRVSEEVMQYARAGRKFSRQEMNER